MTLNKVIKTLRLRKEWTQYELAQMIGVTPKMISFYELGERNPSRKTQQKLANAFGITLEGLIGKNENEKIEKEPMRRSELTRDIENILVTIGAFKEDTIITQEEYDEWLRFLRAQATAYREFKENNLKSL